MTFLERLKKEVMILDGSMGVFLQEEGLPAGYAPDLWNIEKPETIASVHRTYAAAGSQIVITNTFGATRTRLAEYGRHADVKKINAAAVENARRGGGAGTFVAGGLGPCGKMVAPIGECSFDEAVDIFREQVAALMDSGVDLLIIETMFDLMEIKAAIVGANDVRKRIPLIASMTFTADGVTDTGTTPEAAVAVMEGLGVDIIGVNCSTGPAEMLSVVERVGRATSMPVCVQPNAGLPVMEGGRTVFKEPQEALAGFAERFVAAGANIIGGCCGTRPEYIRKAAALVKGKSPAARRGVPGGMLIASRWDALRIGGGYPFVKIGEKINPTGKKKFAEAIKEGKTDQILMAARKQTETGAMALDVNVGVPMIDEPVMMERAVTAIQNVTPLPLVIDSSNNKALEAGMKLYAGRPLLNSVNAEPEKMEAVLPLAKRMGAAVIALTAGEDIPESAQKRFEYAKTILRRAEEMGFRREDIIFDCLAVVVSAMQEGARQTLLTIRMIKEELGCATMVGLSNTSFGLPDRSTINNAFLAMTMAQGMDAAIINPYDDGMHRAAAAASLFTGRDDGCRKYIEMAGDAAGEEKGKENAPSGKGAATALPITERLFNAVIEGEKDSIEGLVKQGLDSGLKAMDIFMDHLTPAIRKLGDLFSERKKFIPHLVASADTMKRGMGILTPLLKEGMGGKSKGTIVFATVKGDVHDIGKNVCVIMLENFGFEVVDLGRSVPQEDILKVADEKKADIIALSALMTTTMIEMPRIISEIREKGLPYKVMVGGAVVTKSFADEIGADGYARDVGSVARVAEELLNGKG